MTISIDMVKKLRDLTLAPLGDCKEALVEAQGDIDQAQEILKKKGAIKADKKADRDTNAGIVKFAVMNNALVGVKLLCETDFVAKNENFGSLVDQLLSMVASESQDVASDAIPEDLMNRMNNLLRDNAVTIGENMKIAYVIKKTGKAYVYNHMGNTIASAVFYTGDDDSLAKDCALQVAAMNPVYVSVSQVDPSHIAKLTSDFTEEVAASGKPADIVSKIVEGKVQKAIQDDILLEQTSIKDPSKKIKELFPQGFSITEMLRVSVG